MGFGRIVDLRDGERLCQPPCKNPHSAKRKISHPWPAPPISRLVTGSSPCQPDSALPLVGANLLRPIRFFVEPQDMCARLEAGLHFVICGLQIKRLISFPASTWQRSCSG